MLTNRIKKVLFGALFCKLSGLQSGYIFWLIGSITICEGVSDAPIPHDFCFMKSKLDPPLPPFVQGILLKEFGVLIIISIV